MPAVEDRLPLILATSFLPVLNSTMVVWRSAECVSTSELFTYWLHMSGQAVKNLSLTEWESEAEEGIMTAWGHHFSWPNIQLFSSLDYRASFPSDVQLKCCCGCHDSHSALLNGCSINKVSIESGILEKIYYNILYTTKFLYCDVFNSSQRSLP